MIMIVIFIIILLILSIVYFLNKNMNNNLKINHNNIAIISTYPSHIECVGFILEYLDNYNIDIYIDGDGANYLDYFKSKYKFNHYHINKFDEINYDKIIKLTSNDPYNIIKKHFSILHMSGNEYPDTKENTLFITLTPFVKPTNFNYRYILSIYKDYIDTNFINKNIGFIGQFIADYVKNKNDIINLIENIDGKLFLFGYTNDKINNNRINNYENINTINMVEKLKQCSYIIIKEHDDRYSGGITIALSLNIPLIMKKSIADIYGIPAIVYNETINELTDYINNININDYIKIKYNLRKFTDKQIEKNKYILKNLI